MAGNNRLPGGGHVSPDRITVGPLYLREVDL